MVRFCCREHYKGLGSHPKRQFTGAVMSPQRTPKKEVSNSEPTHLGWHVKINCICDEPSTNFFLWG